MTCASSAHAQEVMGQTAEIKLIFESTDYSNLVMLMLAAVAANEQSLYFERAKCQRLLC